MELQSPPLKSNEDTFLAMKAKASTDQLVVQDDGQEEKEWMKRVKKFGENSSFSAAVYEFKSKSIIKRIFWAGVVLAAVAGFCAVTAYSIRTLVQEPISTSITVSRKKSLDFPAVTVCSLSFLNTTRVNQLNDELELVEFTLRDNIDDMFEYARNTPPDLDNCQSTADYLISLSSYNEGFSTLVTQDARNDPRVLLERCSFLGENCLDSLTEINTISGVCFTFNGPSNLPVRTVSGTGPHQGLQLKLKTGEQFFSLRSNHGFNVIVHNRDEPPRPESEGVVVGLDSTLYVGMREVVSTDKTRFHSDVECTKRTSYNEAQLMVPNYDTYSPSLCQNECYYKFLADECGCIEDKFYTPNDSPYTTMPSCRFEDLCCETVAFDSFTDACDCPPKCEIVERTLTASSATSSSSEDVNINVYYETLLVESRETTDAYSPWSLISDIGGNTGLFLGFTLLTAAELVMLAVGLLTDCCCMSCKKRLRKKEPSAA